MKRVFGVVIAVFLALLLFVSVAQPVFASGSAPSPSSGLTTPQVYTKYLTSENVKFVIQRWQLQNDGSSTYDYHYLTITVRPYGGSMNFGDLQVKFKAMDNGNYHTPPFYAYFPSTNGLPSDYDGCWDGTGWPCNYQITYGGEYVEWNNDWPAASGTTSFLSDSIGRDRWQQIHWNVDPYCWWIFCYPSPSGDYSFGVSFRMRDDTDNTLVFWFKADGAQTTYTQTYISDRNGAG